MKKLQLTGLDDSSDSDGPDADTKGENVALKDILAENDSDDEDLSPIKSPPTAAPSAASPAKKAAVESAPKINIVSAAKEAELPSSSQAKALQGEGAAQFLKEESSAAANLPTEKEMLDEILQESDEEPPAISYLSSPSRSSPSRTPSSKSVASVSKTPKNEKTTEEISQTFNPIAIVDSYENSSRAEEKAETVAKPIEESMSNSTLRISRMAYTQYKGIGAYLANVESEKTWGRPSCICVRICVVYIMDLLIFFALCISVFSIINSQREITFISEHRLE